METNDIIERMKAVNHRMIKEISSDSRNTPAKKDVEQSILNEPVDIYQRNTNARIENSKKNFPNGTSAVVHAAIANVVRGNGAEGLAHAYRRAKDDSDSLKKKGERDRAEIIRQQYMEEHFIPAIEIVVNYTTPDEVLNSKKALAELDKYALVAGSGNGYTASYIRQAYGNQLGKVADKSDEGVIYEIRKLNRLLDEGSLRTAYSLASGLKQQIDRGDKLASDDDYELLERVVAFYG